MTSPRMRRACVVWGCFDVFSPSGRFTRPAWKAVGLRHACVDHAEAV